MENLNELQNEVLEEVTSGKQETKCDTLTMLLHQSISNISVSDPEKVKKLADLAIRVRNARKEIVSE